ncbi:chemotaxis response regulator protein-glutamate methylesterase [Isosphaeraceae bacterium EP7]
MSRTEPVRVLVVDDSALMRKLLAGILGLSPEITVVGSARDGTEAIELAQKLRPDVITLDVEMPGMSGLETLPLLFAVHEAPVIMVSVLTQERAAVTLEALELGAFDFLPKPTHHQLAELKALGEVLVGKVLAAAQSHVRRPGPRQPKPAARPPSRQDIPTSQAPATTPTAAAEVVVIGISTGGPQALGQVFAGMSPPMPPILIVQHMPSGFTQVFAERLGRQCNLTVKEAEEGDRVLPDQILIAPGGRQMTLTGRSPRVHVSISDGPHVSGHKPSVDALFLSAAKVFGAATTGIIMTGMGRDGVEGCKSILAAGGLTLGQDEATSVVYGMNKAAFLEGGVRRQFALEELPEILARLARRKPRPTPAND